MQTKRKAAKKKSTARPKKKIGKTLVLSPKLQGAAQKCLEQSGKISFRFKEVAVTKLSDLANADVIVN
jgi:hypothetical protein